MWWQKCVDICHLSALWLQNETKLSPFNTSKTPSIGGFSAVKKMVECRDLQCDTNDLWRSFTRVPFYSCERCAKCSKYVLLFQISQARFCQWTSSPFNYSDITFTSLKSPTVSFSTSCAWFFLTRACPVQLLIHGLDFHVQLSQEQVIVTFTDIFLCVQPRARNYSCNHLISRSCSLPLLLWFGCAYSCSSSSHLFHLWFWIVFPVVKRLAVAWFLPLRRSISPYRFYLNIAVFHRVVQLCPLLFASDNIVSLAQ